MSAREVLAMSRIFFFNFPLFSSGKAKIFFSVCIQAIQIDKSKEKKASTKSGRDRVTELW